MNINLNAYKEQIDLHQKFTPNLNNNSLDELLTTLIEEPSGMSLLSQLDLINGNYSQRDLIRALLTVRPSGNLPDSLVGLVDSMLQDELKHKNITNHQDIPRITSDNPASKSISVWDGDISTLKIDAIVNAANKQMEGCFVPFHNCIDNVIHNAAGVMLREDCATVMNLQGELEQTGKAKITRGYNLPAQYVLHTVGPIIRGARPNLLDAKKLANSYESCLNLAKEYGHIKSIAFCSISTGVFGYPLEDAAKIALSTVTDWLQNNPNSIEHIVFNTFGQSATDTYMNLLKDWRE
ncbi:protein-ADP-ribose hydrolase [Marinifilum caeruleilacunae]|uniref:Protein-ADP-ribose hydrolase n=1 Tax=Marinifilum caeruleilacunae TaxID=2499076 RepID=A0ABX1WQE4_9BACT|nr:protein-ADP-ribose hydrolase [Marinifilum caeruleilacunae]NOU58301.1 protein-ADP-ribose hydrolase [Marinifilum caeruleilacunae]